MLLRLTAEEEIEMIFIISIDAFHSNYLIGLEPNMLQYLEIIKKGKEHKLYSFISFLER